MTVESIYDDVALDNVNTAENGNLNYTMYNRLSRRAELRMLDYISGDIENQKAPMPYTSQKVKDWLAPFIKKFKAQVSGGIITRPDDFYGYEDMYRLGTGEILECDEETLEEDNNRTIELLDGGKFFFRCNTYIKDLKPTFKKPIAKMVGKTFEFRPSDLGSVELEYRRYPVFGRIVSKLDPARNDQVIDTVKSQPYEWDEYARELLVFFITDTFAIHTREVALKQQNQATDKLVRK